MNGKPLGDWLLLFLVNQRLSPNLEMSLLRNGGLRPAISRFGIGDVLWPPPWIP